MQKHATALLKLAPLLKSGGLALSTLEIMTPQRASKVSEAVHLISEVRARSQPLDPREAMLEAMLFTLVYYSRQQPSLTFKPRHQDDDSPVLKEGKALRFMAEALTISGWIFTKEEIARSYPSAYAAVDDQLAREYSNDSCERYEANETVEFLNVMNNILAEEYTDQFHAILCNNLPRLRTY